MTGDKQAGKFAETKTILIVHNKTKVIPRGSADILLQRNRHTYKVRLLVIPGSAAPLLSLKSSQQLGLVRTVDSDHLHMVTQQPVLPRTTGNHKDTNQSSNDTSNDPILLEFKVVFEGLGCLPGHYFIRLDGNTVVPVVHAHHTAPVALKDAIRNELDSITQGGVIEPVTEPTPLVSSMVTVRKQNNKVQICIDPQDLNKSNRRAHYPLPTI